VFYKHWSRGRPGAGQLGRRCWRGGRKWFRFPLERRKKATPSPLVIPAKAGIHDKTTRRKLGLLELAKEMHNVSHARRVLGYSRRQAYESRHNFQISAQRGKPTSPFRSRKKAFDPLKTVKL